MAAPVSHRRHCGLLRLLEHFGVVDQAQSQRLAAFGIIGPTCDLNQVAPTVELTVAVGLWRVAQTLGQLAGVVLRRVLAAAQLAHVAKLVQLMAYLGDESGNVLPGDDLYLPMAVFRAGTKRRLSGRRSGGSSTAVVRS